MSVAAAYEICLRRVRDEWQCAIFRFDIEDFRYGVKRCVAVKAGSSREKALSAAISVARVQRNLNNLNYCRVVSAHESTKFKPRVMLKVVKGDCSEKSRSTMRNVHNSHRDARQVPSSLRIVR